LRWRLIKTAFVKRLHATDEAPARKGGRGIWQPRYWEHTIRDESDYAAHVDYCHINPFKHGLVHAVAAWPYSTFHQYVQQGIYPEDWAGEAR
jgi:putative transposase